MSELVSPEHLMARLEKLWRSYQVHQDYLDDRGLFPYRIKITRPTNKTLLHNFDQARQWSQKLSKVFAPHLLTEQVNYSALGRQSMPVAIEFADHEQLCRFLSKQKQWQQFCSAHQLVSQQYPQLKDWLSANPAAIDAHQQQWPQLLNVCHYFIQHPRSNRYLRELDIIGIDSKFIESHKKILKQLLDQLLPPHAINQHYDKLSEHGFEKRFGLKYPKPTVRFRLLDSKLTAQFGGLDDLEVPVEQFAQLNSACRRVIITENKINGLAMPPLTDTLVIFGLGYGIQTLKNIHWLQQCELFYWGDIDSHGFAILSQARQYFPHIQSFLMDQQTLTDHQSLWGSETASKVHKADTLPGLTSTEQTLYRQLKTNVYQPQLRLEQERIVFGYVVKQLAEQFECGS